MEQLMTKTKYNLDSTWYNLHLFLFDLQLFYLLQFPSFQNKGYWI